MVLLSQCPQAMAAGLPVILLDRNEPLVIESGTGYVVSADSQELADQVEWIMRHPRAAENTGKRAQEYVCCIWKDVARADNGCRWRNITAYRGASASMRGCLSICVMNDAHGSVSHYRFLGLFPQGNCYLHNTPRKAGGAHRRRSNAVVSRV